MDPVTIYITGTAGAGKTTLTAAWKSWMGDQGYSVTTVNLDPGMEDPTFEPDVDVREWVKLEDVMAAAKLGPNGAQIAASDMVGVNLPAIRDALEPLRSDYVLVDTPGQVELFAFREASRTIVEELSGDRSMIAFLFDPMLARVPSGFVSLLLLSATVQFRFGLPMMNILAKDDLLTEEERTRVARWSKDRDALYESVSAVPPRGDALPSAEIFRALEILEPVWDVVSTSAREERGIADLYRTVQMAFFGGEDLDKDAGQPSGKL